MSVGINSLPKQGSIRVCAYDQGLPHASLSRIGSCSLVPKALLAICKILCAKVAATVLDAGPTSQYIVSILHRDDSPAFVVDKCRCSTCCILFGPNSCPSTCIDLCEFGIVDFICGALRRTLA
jgi:hypothetical protein